jgi:hypothetical protein
VLLLLLLLLFDVMLSDEMLVVDIGMCFWRMVGHDG